MKKKIFFTYSNDPDDIGLYKEFYKHFATYARSGIIQVVDKDAIFRQSGNSSNFAEYLKESDIAVQLLSVDYMDDEQCVNLLNAAVESQKIVVPILLRDCEWKELQKLASFEKDMLPEDRMSVTKYIDQGKQDEVFMLIARRVKAIALPELASIEPRTTSKTFYYILAGIALVIGGLLTVFSYTRWGDWKVSAAIMLMFLAIGLLALKNYLFPTKFRVG